MKKVLLLIFLLSFCSNLNAKTIYLNCEETVKEVREVGAYEIIYKEGKFLGNIFVKIKKKTVFIDFAFKGGEAYNIISNKKFKKTSLGFKVMDQYKSSEFEVKEFFEFIKPIDNYVFKRSSYVYTAETATDGEDTTDYDGAGKCEMIDKLEYFKLLK